MARLYVTAPFLLSVTALATTLVGPASAFALTSVTKSRSRSLSNLSQKTQDDSIFIASSFSSSSSLALASSTKGKPYSEWTEEEKLAEKESQQKLLLLKGGALLVAAVVWFATKSG